MMLEKYGVEDRKDLIEKELQRVKERLKEKTASVMTNEEMRYLEQREKDLEEALQTLA